MRCGIKDCRSDPEQANTTAHARYHASSNVSYPPKLAIFGRKSAATSYRTGIKAKYFVTSLAMLKVVSAPRIISICLPISTTSIN